MSKFRPVAPVLMPNQNAPNQDRPDRIYPNEQSNSMQNGTIARLTEKGFGFISRDGEEKDLFFHMNELVNVKFDELREGDKVTFEVGESPKGPNAVKVSRA
jgi:cold shock protein